jgi:hypothetical protein
MLKAKSAHLLPPCTGRMFTLSTTTNRTYLIGETISFNLSFPKDVTVVGTPYLNMTIGPTTRSATYVSGSGSATLLFQYTTVAGDNDSDGISITPTVELNPGDILKYSTTYDCGTGITIPSLGVPVVQELMAGDHQTELVEISKFRINEKKNRVLVLRPQGVASFRLNFVGNVTPLYHNKHSALQSASDVKLLNEVDELVVIQNELAAVIFFNADLEGAMALSLSGYFLEVKSKTQSIKLSLDQLK